MNKKAETMALRIVIVGIILIIILAVVLVIFGRGIGQQREFLDNTTGDVTGCEIGKDCDFIDRITGQTKSPNTTHEEPKKIINYEA